MIKMKHSFIPRKDSELNAFEKNYKAKLAVHAESLNLKQDEVELATGIIEKSINSYNDMISKRAKARSAAAEYRINRKASEKELRRLSRKIKASVNYDDSKGEDLKIITPKLTEISPEEKQPVLKAKINGMIVELKFNKKRKDSFNLYSRRGKETEFTLIVTNTELYYSDDREKLVPGKPEVREYYAFFRKNDAEIGKKSDTLKVIIP